MEDNLLLIDEMLKNREERLQESIRKVDEWMQKHKISYSSLKHFRESPKHFINYISKPKVEKEEYNLGKAIECLALERDRFNEKFEIYDKPNLRSDANKLAHQQKLEEAAKRGITLLSKEDYLTATYCYVSLMDNIQSREMLENKLRIQTKLEWKDKETGLHCIGYSDMETIFHEEDFVAELKSTKSSEPVKFNRDYLNLDYLIQTGSYKVGYKRCKFRFPNFVTIAVETCEPYNVTISFCDSKLLQIAEEEFLGSLKAFKYCLDNQLWNMGYDFRLMQTRDFFSLNVPPYYQRKFTGFDLTDEKELENEEMD